jgi:hypothetical protein
VPLSQSALTEAGSVATTAPSANRRKGCPLEFDNKVLGIAHAKMRLVHRNCYYTDQLSAGEMRKGVLARELLADLLAAMIPKRRSS